MKKLFTFFGVIALLIVMASPSSAQEAGIYSKGTWHYNINQNMSIGFYGNKANGEKTDKKTVNSSVSVGAEYFALDNVAFGFRYDRTRDVDKNGSKEIWRWNTFDISALYGRSFDKFNLQGRGYIGFGGAKDYADSYGYDDKGKIFNWGIEVESPINISGGCNGFLTPGIGYGYQKLNWDGPYSKSTGFYFDVDLTFFVPMDDHYCDIKNGCKSEDLRYGKGSVSMGASTPFNFYLGTWKAETDYGDGYTQSYHESSNYFEWCLYAYYYVINNLGIGAHMDIEHYWWASKDTDENDPDYEKGSGTQFIFMPMAIYNLPLDGCLNNLFVNTGFGFGVDNWKDEGYEYSNEGKNSVTNFYFGAGYYYHFTKFLAMSPRIGYNRYCFKDKTSNSGYKSSDEEMKRSKAGLLLDVGITYFIWPKKSARYLD